MEDFMANTIENQNTFVEDLLRQIWITKGARFNAHRRLRIQGQHSIRAISLLTAYLLIVSLFLVIPIFNLSSFQTQLVSYGTSAIAILLLVLSILEGAKEYALKGERMHQCAIELSGLYNAIKIEYEKHSRKSTNSLIIASSATKYQEILMRAAENHDIIDYRYFQSLHSKDFNFTKLEVFWIKLLWFVKVYAVYALLIWGPPIIIFLLVLNQWTQK